MSADDFFKEIPGSWKQNIETHCTYTATQWFTLRRPFCQLFSCLLWFDVALKTRLGVALTQS